MSIFQQHNTFCRAARSLVFAIGITGFCAVCAYAQVEDDISPEATTPPPPYALFQYSTLTGSGNSITAGWIPIVTAKGTIYKNLTLLFNVDSSGNLTLATGYPHVIPSPPPVVYSFKAGKYIGPPTVCTNMLIAIGGPGVAPGGATEWTLSAASGAATCTYPDSATWYVGSLASSPLAARLKAAGITSTAWSYGVGGTPYSGAWASDSLLGFSQVGNTLTIVSFTKYGKDYSEPVDQITYTLSQ
jgi:hypothetical protein